MMLWLLSIFDQLRLLIIFFLCLLFLIFLIKKKKTLSIILLVLIVFLFYAIYFYYKEANDYQLNYKASLPFLRIIQQNCWGKNEDPERLISVIQEKNPDIVFLQECNPKIFQKIHASDLSITYDIFAQFESNKGRLFDNQLVILARGFDLIKKFDNTSIPVLQIFLKEKSGKNRVINLINVHLERPYLIGFSYYEHFIDSLNQDIKPIIMAGDFNLVSWSKQLDFIMKKLEIYDSRKGYGLYPTYPACLPYPLFNIRLLPVFPIDNILISSQFSVHDFEILPFIGSDHYGIQVDLSWRL